MMIYLVVQSRSVQGSRSKSVSDLPPEGDNWSAYQKSVYSEKSLGAAIDSLNSKLSCVNELYHDFTVKFLLPEISLVILDTFEYSGSSAEVEKHWTCILSREYHPTVRADAIRDDIVTLGHRLYKIGEGSYMISLQLNYYWIYLWSMMCTLLCI